MSFPNDWYWMVIGDASKVYSSARSQYVETDDADYVLWLSTGKLPTHIKSEQALDEVLISHKLRPVTNDAAMSSLRVQRDAKLAASDWIVVKSYEAGEPVPQSWIDYRQALRDLPATTQDPFNPVWPSEPLEDAA